MGRLRRLTPARIRRELTSRAGLVRKGLALRARYGHHVATRPIFVVGCQRSGTNMVMWTLERSPEVWAHHEHRRSPAFRDYRLRSTEVVDRLIRRCPAPVVSFKPICDSHLTDRYLERHEGARAIWIYRRYPDVANSAARRFGSHVRDILRWIVRGDTDWLGWRGERLPRDVVDLIHQCFTESMRNEEAASLFWYMRTRFYFDLGLDGDGRVLLVRYEDLVSEGASGFERLFAFAGVDFDPRFLEGVFASSVAKDRFPEIDPRIRRACEDLQERLDETHRAALAREGTAMQDAMRVRA